MEKEEIAKKISDWTLESNSMLPKSPDEILKYLMEGKGVLVLNQEGEIAGFGAVTFNWPDNWKELGAVIVDPGKREHGFGHKVVKELIATAKEIFPDSKLFALCNDKSLKIFLDNGAEVITDSDLLPLEVFGECVHCPKFIEAKNQGKICCDTPVTIKETKSEVGGCYR
ncbi:MAG TPA: GNAT family N-acetyltransferase [Candidatus Saccharimonadales bacterium]|jgi:N-acetylglutamate synthase-like GNAT family acetyltransferase|nr:GNAT family N-acetyltransferase [Candidatus Saccharimonadales bacterium]